MDAMTREQKQRLGFAVMSIVADAVEVWSERQAWDTTIQDIPADVAAHQIARWLAKLPTGGYWDMRLPQ